MLFSWVNFCFFATKKSGKFLVNVFFSVNLTSFAIFGAKFAKISTSQIWHKKHWFKYVVKKVEGCFSKKYFHIYLVKSSYGSSPPWLYHKIEKQIVATKGGRGSSAHAGHRPTPHSDGETMRPCQSRRVRITCTPPDSRRPVWLVCLFVWWALPAPWNHVQGNCEDSAALSQGWSRNFCFARDLSVTSCNKRQESIFCQIFQLRSTQKLNKGSLWASPALMTIFTLKKYCSHPSLVFFFLLGPLHPYSWLKLGLQIVGRLLITNHLDESLWLTN